MEAHDRLSGASFSSSPACYVKWHLWRKWRPYSPSQAHNTYVGATSIDEESGIDMDPVAQHWTWHWAPSAYRKPLTWLQGWLTWFSWVALLAGGTNITANITTVLASGVFPSFQAQGWQTVLIMYAFLAVTGGVSMYAFSLLPWLELLVGLMHVSNLVAERCSSLCCAC